MTVDADLDHTVQGSRLTDLLAAPSPDPLNLVALAAAVARDGDRRLASFTTEELAATLPPCDAVPRLPDDSWLDALDPARRGAAEAAALRSLAARGLVVTDGPDGRLRGDLRVVHELRAAAPTIVSAEVRRGGRSARHRLHRAAPGLVLHLAEVAGAHHGALRTEPSAGLLLAAVVADVDRAPAGSAPADLLDPVPGRDRQRVVDATSAADAVLHAVAHHRTPDGRSARAQLSLWRTDVGLVLAVPDPGRSTPQVAAPGARLHLVDDVVAVAVCVGLLAPSPTPEPS